MNESEFLNIDQALYWCNQITYKPDHYLSFHIDSFDGRQVIVASLMVDTLDSETKKEMLFNPIKGLIFQAKENLFSPSLMFWQIHDMIKNFEDHERLEWLKYSGVTMTDPHKIVNKL